jgi:hypothetical protein
LFFVGFPKAVSALRMARNDKPETINYKQKVLVSRLSSIVFRRIPESSKRPSHGTKR